MVQKPDVRQWSLLAILAKFIARYASMPVLCLGDGLTAPLQFEGDQEAGGGSRGRQPRFRPRCWQVPGGGAIQRSGAGASG